MTGKYRSKVMRNKQMHIKITEIIKSQLTYLDKVRVDLDDFYDNKPNKKCELYITRKEVRRSIKKSQLKPSEIEKVILVGGCSQIPKIRKMLSDKFKETKINSSINCNEVIAKGAFTAHNIYIVDVDNNDRQFARLVVKQNTNICHSHDILVEKDNPEQTEASIIIKEDKKIIGNFIVDNLSTESEYVTFTLKIEIDGSLSVHGSCGNSEGQQAVKVPLNMGKIEEKGVTNLKKKN
ncbi:Heat shock protein [Entamoeba marina]